ncbi:MAG TPA: hypothetical protein VKG79_16055 [Bryobacteraceae bacterium]|nr:hypothetical protein [Bryobacteraceae bacterium]
MLERYAIPIAPYALLALFAAISLIVFLSSDREIRRLKSRLGGKNPAVLSQKELQLRLENLTGRLREAEERASIPPQPAVVRPGLNLTRRNQVIRLSRRGQPASHIAASLSMPRKEVELLLKIHNLSLDNAPDSGA